MNQIRVEMTSHSHGKVFIDDVEIQDVVSLRIAAGVGATNEVEITLRPAKVVVIGPFDVVSRAAVESP